MHGRMTPPHPDALRNYQDRKITLYDTTHR